VSVSLIPVTPKRPQPLPKWIEANVRLPAGVAAEPGPIKLYPYQCGIAAAIADPQIERVTVLKSARVGHTAVMTCRAGAFRGARAITDPCADADRGP
jgi:phage terminase large subunit GpA-like protein